MDATMLCPICGSDLVPVRKHSGLVQCAGRPNDHVFRVTQHGKKEHVELRPVPEGLSQIDDEDLHSSVSNHEALPDP